MALSQTAKIALTVAAFGSLAFILGVIAENKKVICYKPIKTILKKGVLQEILPSLCLLNDSMIFSLFLEFPIERSFILYTPLAS